MPRYYEKVRGASRRQKYDKRQLEAALKDVRTGKLSIRAAAIKNSVPFSTLQERHATKLTKPYGGQTAMSPKDEDTLAKCPPVEPNPSFLLDLHLK